MSVVPTIQGWLMMRTFSMMLGAIELMVGFFLLYTAMEYWPDYHVPFSDSLFTYPVISYACLLFGFIAIGCGSTILSLPSTSD